MQAAGNTYVLARDAVCVQVSGHPAVAPHMTKFYGIRNGIDQDIWDPLEDRFLPRCALRQTPEWFLHTLH